MPLYLLHLLLHRLPLLTTRKINQMQSIVQRASRTRASFPSLRIQNVTRNFSPTGSWTYLELSKARASLTLARGPAGSLFAQRGERETTALFTRWTSIEIILT